MLNWYQSGIDPTREMIKLTTYLGHASPEHTYWYIEAVPALLALASARAEPLWRWREVYEPIITALARTAVLHRPAVHPDERQPEHDCWLSRHLPLVTALRE